MKTFRYKDTVVANNTQMAQLLADGKKKEADNHYRKLDADFHKHFPKETWDAVQQQLRSRRV